MQIFYKNKGTISVFLTLILLPVLLMGGMTVDVSRIYMSKAVISDAGEMAMNAGLAGYNEKLHDEYGLLVMDETPETMEKDLEGYFNGSLNGTGLPDAEDYKKILDLLTKSFEAINVQGSEIYRTEVEKQQIIEYMKYRAPVCIAELVNDKINQLKDTKKMVKAMEAEMDFAEDMEDCQDAFKEAKEALDALNQEIQSFPSVSQMREELSDTEKDYKEIVSKCLLMRAAIQRYDEKSSSRDIKEMAEQYIKAAKNVDLSSPYQSLSFSQYINSLYYKNTVDSLGGIDKLLQESQEEDSAREADEGAELSEADNGAESEEREEAENIVRQYKEQRNRLEGYPALLLSIADETVGSHSAALKNYLDTAQSAQKLASTSNTKLNEVKKKLTKAEKSFHKWDDATKELEAVGKASDMRNEVDEYGKFFSDGNGKADLEQLESLMADVKWDRDCFREWEQALKKEKFFGQSIAEQTASAQMNEYRSRADAAVAGATAQYSSLESAREEYITHYEHTEVSGSNEIKPINDHPFYQRLREYCTEKEDTESKEEQNKVRDSLEESKQAGEDAGRMDAYPTFNWSSLPDGMRLPSALEGADAPDAGDNLTSLSDGSNIKDKGQRRDVIAKFKQSVKEANSFLDAVDRIVADGIENLYVAEYAMQMFSYYTVDKANGAPRAEEDIISISGYKLKDHQAYRAECEYILWGEQESQTNVKNTVMLIFGIRLLFNSFFAFTDGTIDGIAYSMAAAIAGAAPYLIPVIKVVIKLGFAGVETADDMKKIKEGYGVVIFKDSSTWATFPLFGNNTSTEKVTFDYSEYLRVFLNVSMLAGKEVGILGRIADCIQVNAPDTDLLTSYTMLSIQAEVSSRTTFMRKISDLGENGAWGFPDDSYTITYQSILGY